MYDKHDSLLEKWGIMLGNPSYPVELHEDLDPQVKYLLTP